MRVKATLLALVLYVTAALPAIQPGILQFKRLPLLSDWLDPTALAMVVNPTGYTILLCHNNASPADGITYYFGQLCLLNAAMVTTDTDSTNAPVTIPSTGVIRSINYTNLITTPGGATVGQFATLAIDINHGTFTTVSSGAICAHANCRGISNFTGLSIPVTAGQTVNMRFIAPTYTDANPTGMYAIAQVAISTP